MAILILWLSCQREKMPYASISMTNLGPFSTWSKTLNQVSSEYTSDADHGSFPHFHRCINHADYKFVDCQEIRPEFKWVTEAHVAVFFFSGILVNGQIIGDKKLPPDGVINTYFYRFGITHQTLGVRLEVSTEAISLFQDGKWIKLLWSEAASLKGPKLVEALWHC